ncbi:hypothetical protein CMI37_20165 [Candidatus Pacearchaeota archaeon]|nr:hypothetical protein [Candidatus Pacearchaeota archaeon]
MNAITKLISILILLTSQAQAQQTTPCSQTVFTNCHQTSAPAAAPAAPAAAPAAPAAPSSEVSAATAKAVEFIKANTHERSCRMISVKAFSDTKWSLDLQIKAVSDLGAGMETYSCSPKNESGHAVIVIGVNPWFQLIEVNTGWFDSKITQPSDGLEIFKVNARRKGYLVTDLGDVECQAAVRCVDIAAIAGK